MQRAVRDDEQVVIDLDVEPTREDGVYYHSCLRLNPALISCGDAYCDF